MPAVGANKIEMISQAKNPKLAIIAAAGDLSKAEVFEDLVLVGTYFRPEKTAGGIIRPLDNVKEDEFQGKVGLVLKAGPLAQDEDGTTKAEHGTWVVYNTKDAWQITINGCACRLVPYPRIRMRVSDPNVVF